MRNLRGQLANWRAGKLARNDIPASGQRPVGQLASWPALTLTFWFATALSAPVSETHTVERLVAPSPFHGVHGLTFDRNNVLYAGSVVGESVYRVDVGSGAVDTFVGPPQGMADDLVFLADGTLLWTAIMQGVVRARAPDGKIREIAKLPSINSINVRKSDGRVFAGQVFGGDGVWELDPTGVKPPRNIVKDPGGFNGFDIGPDGALYGPLWFKKQIVRIDPESGAIKTIADGFDTPAAANFDSKWNLYVLDTARGEVVRVDIKTGAKRSSRTSIRRSTISRSTRRIGCSFRTWLTTAFRKSTFAPAPHGRW